MERTIEIGKVYRHFKGKYYFIENVVYHSETKEEFVLYKALYASNKTWIRPLNMFLEQVEPNREDNITNQIFRFELDTKINN